MFFLYYTIWVIRWTIGLKIVKAFFQFALNRMGQDRYFYVEEAYHPDFKSQIKRLVVYLPGKGCWWAKQCGGGCTMCGFQNKLKEVDSEKFSSRDLIYLFRIALLLEGDNVDEVAIFNGGSFLNSGEISLPAQRGIVDSFSRTPIKSIYIESRPEFIIAKNIKTLQTIMPNKKLKVGIGLESANDEFREVNINKGFDLKEYERALAVLKQCGAQSLTYVLLKPIGLSEKEAIEDAISTIDYAFKDGTDEVALESSFIQPGTAMEKLYGQGSYTPPWLWSIIEVAKRTHALGFVQLGSFNDEPPPIATPSNCGKCDPAVLKAIAHYLQSHSLQEFNKLDCECKERWQREVNQK